MIINRNNYEEYFLLYIDRELGPDEQLMVEDFVRVHPDLEKEFDLLKQTAAFPPVMIFEGKERLYKKENRRIVPQFWLRIAATLIILLAGGWYLLLMTGETRNDNQPDRPPKQITLNRDQASPARSRKAAPESAAKPANQENGANPENLPERDPVVATKSAGGQKENVTEEANPEKNSPESDEASIPSTANGQPSTEFINHQPSRKTEIADLAQNIRSPEINAPNPSAALPPTVNRQRSTVNRQPSTDPESSQSILVFNNDNKTVRGLFQKLLANSGNEQATADNRKRKIKISVFQFNVSK
jgi:cytoskeletal protein RodZ